MKYLLLFVLIFIAIAQQGCVDCGPQAELTARIDITGDSLRLDSIYALKALDQRVMNDQLPKTRIPYLTLDLPISLHSDTTTYIFRFDSRIDTLAFYYKRIFRYKGDCGFVNDAAEPPHGNHYYSTFKKVKISYGSYISPGKQPWLNPRSGSGISIRITL